MITKQQSHAFALTVIALVIAALLMLGVQLLTVPRVFLLARPLFAYEGYALIALAVLLAWFREWAAQKIVWIFLEMHRMISALTVAVALGAEGFMHSVGIPHMEGWWLPLLTGGATATLVAGMKKWKKYFSAREAGHG